jgi:hypothetical protein
MAKKKRGQHARLAKFRGQPTREPKKERLTTARRPPVSAALGDAATTIAPNFFHIHDTPAALFNKGK